MTKEQRNSDDEPVSRIRILHLLPDKGNRSHLLENLVTGLDKKIFSQLVCYLSGNDDKLSPLEKWGYEVVDLGIPKKKLKRFQPSLVLQLARILREQEVDIVHCQRHKCTVYGTLAAWMAGKNVKVVTTVHGLNRTRTLGRKLLNRAIFGRISRIIAVSESVRHDILKTNRIPSPDKVVTVYNGIDTKRFSASGLTQQEARSRLDLADKDAFVFGTVGRLTKVKGQAVLLRAFARVCQKHPNSWLVLVGKGPLEKELRDIVAELNIDKRVLFLGYRKDIPEVLRAYDVFVLPSLAEGLCLALVEAMAVGVPVIASRVGGVPEVLNSPDLGVMVSPSSVGELALAMERFCEMDKVKQNEIGKALRDRVLDEFTKDKMISAMTKEYIAVMNNARSQ
jgi:glycosyltransferase involved in cell wall biosynthesis